MPQSSNQIHTLAIDAYHQCHFELLDRLCQKDNIALKYILSGSQENFKGDQQTIKKIVPKFKRDGVAIEKSTELMFGEQINKLIDRPLKIDRHFIEQCKSIESYFLRVSDRHTAFPISVYERRQYYLLLLNHFYLILTELNIGRLISFDTPHSLSSIILYKLCALLKIQCIQLEYHTLDDYSVVFDGYEFPSIPKDYCQEESLEYFKNSLNTNLVKNLQHTDQYLSAYKKRDQKVYIKDHFLWPLAYILRTAAKVITNLIQGIFSGFLKKEVLHFTSLNNIKNRFNYRLSINKPMVELVNKNIFYNKLARIPDLEKPYIYFGMHMQPEKTTLPMAGEFDNPLLAITMLSKALPDGWMLYVKEHPNQFNNRKVTNNNFRNKALYKAILKLKNVFLVPLSYASDALISKAQIVSTLTGSIGWEALKQSIPVIAFGNTYYKACSAVESPESVESTQKAIERLSNMSKQSIQLELYRYLHFYEKNHFLCNSGNNEVTISNNSLSRDKQLEHLEQHFLHFIH